MWIEFLRPHGIYEPGAVVFDPHPGAADTLVGRGIARRVKRPKKAKAGEG